MTFPRQFLRVETLVGENGLAAFRKAHVVIVGYGAVGSACTAALVRSGIGHVRIIDADVYDVSNINRQFGASHRTIGHSKVDVGKAELLDLVPDLDIETVQRFIREGEMEDVFAAFADGVAPQIVVDAIDSVDAKTALLSACVQNGTRVYSSMGAARKRHPEMIRFDDISKTSVCPLAREIRRRLRLADIHEGVACVFSVEDAAKPTKPSPDKRPVLGSLMTVTAAFGLRLASEILNDILESRVVCD
ncbi:MAG: tRNA threonylcarbamoyladenosine dehydratase [Proteobacteria bacterium]|jgi:tRNA A37 threonylcarbamoyladenosine dehydratase|nr:tRNA threonylcarbamoyladenosine dehydratase [Pseudomonadota bacterium]